ncbi:MAG TPA: alanine racemase, partial [Gammaproteobacteria bacterium]|nr:alanine racemase [Gammaproteobacteria bacterium]
MSRPATVRVDLDALARNFRMLRERSRPGDCAAVVKADAYGLGVERVANRLLREGCRRFFVATLAEAEQLRALAPDAEIGVFEGALARTVDALARIEARPVLNTVEQIERWAGKGRALLHLDTGMNRLGLRAPDVAALAQRRDLLDALELDFVMTHLACADEPDHPLNAEQLARFEQMRAVV